MMATEERRVEAPSIREVLVAGAVAGVVAGVGMGLILSLGTDLIPLIGALYGRESFVWGWIAHLGNSVVFGLVFAAIVSRPLIRPNPPSIGTYLGYGLIYGAMLEIVTGGVFFPLWLQAAGAPELGFPFYPLSGDVEWFVPAIFLGIGHLVYGVLLGATYAYLRDPEAAHRD